jgi:hypothetical protein
VAKISQINTHRGVVSELVTKLVCPSRGKQRRGSLITLGKSAEITFESSVRSPIPTFASHKFTHLKNQN